MSDNPATRFNLRVNDEDKEVFMSFALLNTITGYFRSAEELDQILLNPEIRNSIITELLSERNENGRITKNFDTTKMVVDHDEVLDLLEWVAEHVENFFMKALQRAKQRMKKKQTI
ncbi:hypothetical protein KUL118_01720 [Tenacibaculum sp. KUL118]|nr:hypothetical protein KUL113_03620 [Tenacibaculum sp. KUL113]GFD77310.1 hypothetical protein KUL118_01720 [Tenacibaculum sp. KUL118]